jgi:hypothetical protein
LQCLGSIDIPDVGVLAHRPVCCGSEVTVYLVDVDLAGHAAPDV